jgi:hypothetical protein
MNDSASTESNTDPTVVGVVLAGVLASFVIPGPFDWGSTLIGVVLLFVLFGYAKPPHHWRPALAAAAAASFTLLLALGRPLQLASWPSKQRLDDYIPNANAGTNLWLVWSIAFGALYGGWLGWNWRRKRYAYERTPTFT